MSPLINNVVDNFMTLMKQHGQTEEPFNIHRYRDCDIFLFKIIRRHNLFFHFWSFSLFWSLFFLFVNLALILFALPSEFQKMTLDVITSTAFGIETESVKNGDSIWLQKIRWLVTAQSKGRRPLSRRILVFLMSKYGIRRIFGWLKRSLSQSIGSFSCNPHFALFLPGQRSDIFGNVSNHLGMVTYNFFRNIFFGSLIGACIGSFANVFEGTSPLYMKVGKILRMSKNGSWALVDAWHFFLQVIN